MKSVQVDVVKESSMAAFFKILSSALGILWGLDLITCEDEGICSVMI